jgi:hypothetical protein
MFWDIAPDADFLLQEALGTILSFQRQAGPAVDLERLCARPTERRYRGPSIRRPS